VATDVSGAAERDSLARTFGRVFAALDPTAFETAFLGWVQTLVPATDGEVVAIDGKTLRRSHDRTHDRAALHLVSAWAKTNSAVFGQVATDAHSNEITAIPALLDSTRAGRPPFRGDRHAAQRPSADPSHHQ